MIKNSSYEKYDLNRKVDRFIQQYSRRLKSKGSFTDIGEFVFPRRLRDFIESKAVYSELRWSEVYGTRRNGRLIDGVEREFIFPGNEYTLNDEFSWEKFSSLAEKTFDGVDEREINQNVLYRIIERGGNRSGPRRGVLFARDFELDINIPVSYSLDLSDPHLFEWLLSFNPKELDFDRVCPINYFSRTSEKDRLREAKLGEVFEEMLLVNYKMNVPVK